MKSSLLPFVAACACAVSYASAAVVHRAYTDPDYPQAGFPGVSSSFDFNGDGSIDLTLQPTGTSRMGVLVEATAGVIQSTSFSAGPLRYFAVAALPTGAVVQNQPPPDTGWALGNVSLIETTSYDYGQIDLADVAWKGGSPYFGFAFHAADGVHFGWVKVLGVDSLGTSIHSWAYETEAGRPILVGAVPEPGVVFLLAATVAWSGGWRRRW